VSKILDPAALDFALGLPCGGARRIFAAPAVRIGVVAGLKWAAFSGDSGGSYNFSGD
jgi:hypothetical protein